MNRQNYSVLPTEDRPVRRGITAVARQVARVSVPYAVGKKVKHLGRQQIRPIDADRHIRARRTDRLDMSVRISIAEIRAPDFERQALEFVLGAAILTRRGCRR